MMKNPLPKKLPKNFMWIVVAGVVGYLLYKNFHRN